MEKAGDGELLFKHFYGHQTVSVIFCMDKGFPVIGNADKDRCKACVVSAFSSVLSFLPNCGLPLNVVCPRGLRQPTTESQEESVGLARICSADSF